jgi:hypothetical protein
MYEIVQIMKNCVPIHQDYIPRMKEDSVPEGLQGNKDLIIFGNIQVSETRWQRCRAVGVHRGRRRQQAPTLQLVHPRNGHKVVSALARSQGIEG